MKITVEKWPKFLPKDFKEVTLQFCEAQDYSTKKGNTMLCLVCSGKINDIIADWYIPTWKIINLKQFTTAYSDESTKWGTCMLRVEEFPEGYTITKI
jgi:hypothetical protein